MFNEIPVHKTILAKLFAKENISVIHSNVKTAMFDVVNRTMYLPYWKNVSLEMYDMLTSHEAGHGLDTPTDGFHENNKVYKGPIRSYLNCVEDARIEKLQLRRYPGLKDAYQKAYGELLARDFFKLKPNEDLSKRYFGDRLNLYFKLGRWGHLNVPILNKTEQDFLKRVSLAETFDEVRQLAKEIMAYDKARYKDERDGNKTNGGEGGAKKKGKQKQNSSGKGQKSSAAEPDSGESDDGDDSEESDNNDGEESDQSSDGGDGQDGQEGDQDGQDGKDGKGPEGEGDGVGAEKTSSKKGKAGSDEADGEGDGQGKQKSSKKGDKQEKGTSSLPSSSSDGFGRNTGGAGEVTDEEFEQNTDFNASDKAFHENVGKLVETKDFQEVGFMNLPKYDSEKFYLSAKDTIKIFEDQIRRVSVNVPAAAESAGVAYTKFRQKHLSSVNYLIKEFEMRKAADEHKRTLTTKMGDLNMAKLTNYKFSEDIFRRSDSVTEGKNHGIVMLLDMSSSMTSIYHKTVEQLLILIEFCHRLNIPFEAYGFSDNGSMIGELNKRHPQRGVKLNVNDIIVGHNIESMALIRLIDSSITGMDYRKLMGYLLAHSYQISQRYGSRSSYSSQGNNKSSDKDAYELNVNGNIVALSSTPALSLSGTPLIEAMYLMPRLVKTFKQRTGAQIVHFFNLTDGVGGSIEQYVAMTGMSGPQSATNEYIFQKGYNYSSRTSATRTKLIFNDLDSRKIYEYTFNKDQQTYLANHIYDVSMNLLTQRLVHLGCNVININLLPGGGKREVSSVLQRALSANAFFDGIGDPSNTSKNEIERRVSIDYAKNGFAKVESKLYTHEFFMNANIEDSDEFSTVGSLELEANNTVKSISNQFQSVMKSTMNSRLLAIEFSKLISQ